MIRSKLKNFSKDTVLYGVGDALGRLIAVVLLPILSRVFTPADYGVVDILSISYSFMLMTINLGVPSGLQKYYYIYNDDSQRKEMVSSSIFFMILIASMVSIVFVLLSSLLSDFFFAEFEKINISITVLALCLPIELLLNNLVLLLRLNRKVVIFSAINIIRIIITPLLTYCFVVVLQIGIKGIFFAKLICLTILTISLFYVNLSELILKIKFSVYKKILMFGISGHPGMLLKQIIFFIPQYILAYFAPLSAVGLFGIASRISKIVTMFIQAFNMAWNPFAFSNAGSSDEKRVVELVFKYFSSALILLFLTLSLFAKEVLIILTPAKYHSAYILVPFLVFFFSIQGVVLILSTILYIKERVSYTSYLMAVQLLVFLISAFILVPRMHSIGLIVSMDIAAVFYFALYQIVIRKVFYMDLSLVQLGLVLVIASSGIVFFYSYSFGFLFDILLKLLFGLSFLIVSIFILTDDNEKRSLKKFVGSIA